MKKIISLALVLWVFQAAAAPSVADYEKHKNSNTIKTYVLGLGEAFLYANINLEFNNKAPLFCPPRQLALTTENYVQILDKELRIENFFDSDAPIGLVLLEGLKKTFPCKK
jgi:hypothetical protein